MSSIDVSGLTQSFGDKRVLDELDLWVPAGSVTAVLGESGCGKTTLLRGIAGLLRPDSGRIQLGDVTVCDAKVWMRPERRNVGLVPQEGALFPHLDVAGNVAFGLVGSRRSKAARVSELLELVGMPGSGSQRPNQLSGGMQQRVAVARALSRHPNVVLLDEPFSALDTGLREAVRADVFRAIAEDGATALLVTHDQEEALGVADRVAVMRAGRIVQEGTPAAVYSEPVDRQAAAFLGESVELPATITDVSNARQASPWRAECIFGDISVRPSGDPTHIPAPGDRGTVVFRPEELGLLKSVEPQSSAEGALVPGHGGTTATVAAVHFHGHDCLVRVRLPDGRGATVRLLGPTEFEQGDQVWVRHLHPPRFFAG